MFFLICASLAVAQVVSNSTTTTTTTGDMTSESTAADATDATTDGSSTATNTPAASASNVTCPSNWQSVDARKCVQAKALAAATFLECFDHCRTIGATMFCPESRADLAALSASDTTWLGIFQRKENKTVAQRPRDGWIPLRKSCVPLLAWQLAPDANGSLPGTTLENPNDFHGVDEPAAAYGLLGRAVVHDLEGGRAWFVNTIDRTNATIACACELGGEAVPLSLVDRKRLDAVEFGAAAVPALAALAVSLNLLLASV